MGVTKAKQTSAITNTHVLQYSVYGMQEQCVVSSWGETGDGCSQMLLRGVMSTRGDGPEMHEGDMFFVLDNCFHHHGTQVLKCFVADDGKPLHVEKRLIYMNLDEDSLRQRKRMREARCQL